MHAVETNPDIAKARLFRKVPFVSASSPCTSVSASEDPSAGIEARRFYDAVISEGCHETVDLSCNDDDESDVEILSESSSRRDRVSTLHATSTVTTRFRGKSKDHIPGTSLAKKVVSSSTPKSSKHLGMQIPNTGNGEKEYSLQNISQFLRAARDGNFRDMDRLLRQKKVDIDVQDVFGWTAAMCAAGSGSVVGFKFLKERGANLSLRETSGSRRRSAFDIAMEFGHRTIMDMIIGKTHLDQLQSSSRPSYFDSIPTTRSRSEKHSSDRIPHSSASTVSLIDRSPSMESFPNSVPPMIPRVSSNPPPIPPSNLGYRLLIKSGWRKGSGLGRDENGVLNPLGTVPKNDRRGLGAKSTKSPRFCSRPSQTERGRPSELLESSTKQLFSLHRKKDKTLDILLRRMLES